MSGNKLAAKWRQLRSILPEWNRPPAGKQLDLKEWIMFILGSIGCYGATTLTPFVTLTQGIYVAAACSINVDHVALIGVISSIIAIVTTPLISWLLDNTNTRWGKFRPYLLFFPIPLVACFFAFGQIVRIQNYTMLVVLYAVVYNIFNFFVRIYTAAYNGIPQVISPSMQERTQLMSIGLMFSSLGPTIVGFLYPMLANILYETGEGGNGVNQIGTYVWLLPVFAAAFLLVGVALALGVKERMVVPKNFKQRQSFLEGCRKSISNKYFLILNSSAVLGSLKFTIVPLQFWYIIYSIAPQLTAAGYASAASVAQSLIVTVIGGANVPGMLFSPLLIKKIGTKNLMLLSYLVMAIAMVPMLLFANAWVHIACIFLINVGNGFLIVLNPACQAQINDYQQFKTGDRIEGFLSQLGTGLLTAVGMGTAFIAPAIYKSFGYIDSTSVLYQHETLFGIARAIAGLSLGSLVLGAIPFFFWDLTERKHNKMMEILAVRARLADGEIDEEEAAVQEREMKGDEML